MQRRSTKTRRDEYNTTLQTDFILILTGKMLIGQIIIDRIEESYSIG